MLDLKPTITIIKRLLLEDTQQSVTYAALEARLAIERVCYERLRQAHDYISHAQLKRWQPGSIVRILTEHVDPHVTETRVFSISSKSTEDGSTLQDDDFVEIGREIGFDAAELSKMWQALAKLALHAHLPEHKNDRIPHYGDRDAIKSKVEQALSLLSELSQSTMSLSGFGEEVSFICSCGERNRRRADLLRESQSVYCINPQCMASFKVEKHCDQFQFAPEELSVNCGQCDKECRFHLRDVMRMEKNELGKFTCDHCGFENGIIWRLYQARSRKIDRSSEEDE